MKKLVASIPTPGRLTVLAALFAGLAAPVVTQGAPAAPTHLVISQVYGGGGNSGAPVSNDFVELFNPTGAAINVNGWSVQYASRVGTSWQVTPLGNKTIQPGQYLLIQEAKGTGTQPGLPTADVIGTIPMSATDGKIVLSNSTVALTGAAPGTAATPNATVIDMIAFGGTTTPLEGTPTASLSNTLAGRRVSSCVDTDNNNADFELVTPTARNSAVEAQTCAAGPAIVPVCPASLAVEQGSFGSTPTPLTASDEDGIVSAATIIGGSVPGISLAGFTAASGNGASASVNINVAASVAVGSYPVVVNFTNNDAQQKSCTVNVNVQTLAALTHTIPEIQGTTGTSPFNNSTQTAEGVITVKVGNGFFMQDISGTDVSGAPTGIFVFGGATNALPGDMVRVTGTVTEFKPTGGDRTITEIKDASQIFKRPGSFTVTPTNIQLPGDGLAKYESMLVHFTNPLTVNDTGMLGERGELTLSAGRREVPTNRYPPGSAGALALAAANAANIIVIDDRLTTSPNPIPYIGEGSTVRSGDTVTDLVGVVDYASIGNSNANFKLQPLADSPPTFSRSNPRTLGPEVAPGNLKVAAANVLNFFTTFTKGGSVVGSTTSCQAGCRGADDLAEFIRQRDKIVNALKAIDADVLGLMEIQNNGDLALGYLVDSLNAAIGSTTYAFVPAPPNTGTDAIRVAMIYKPSKVSLVGASMSDGDSINNRPPMAQTFKAANGAKFSLIVNHLKSKGGCPAGTGGDADHNDSQGCWNATRVQQAQRLANFFIPQVVSTSGDPDVLVVGDMNSHGFEDPINFLTGTGIVNELERFVRPNGMVYSYVFDGESGYLDHALASASLDSQVAGATEWHNNADEPEVIDYNTNLGTFTTAKPQDLYVNNPYRASDHDPVVISLNLTPTFVDATTSFTTYRSGLNLNRATGQFSGTFSFTNKTGAAINGPFQLELAGLPAGVTLANATAAHNGAPYITASNASLAPGATITVSLVFNNPSKGAIPYTPTIYSGTF